MRDGTGQKKGWEGRGRGMIKEKKTLSFLYGTNIGLLD